MKIELRLIRLYSFIEDCYNNELQWYCQRFSANGHTGNFTDVELLTCYFFALLEEEKFQVKKMYEYIEKHWHDWFPDLPSYQSFNKRLNRLQDAFPLLLGIVSSAIQPVHGFASKDMLIDSVPIMLSKGKRKGKVAQELADYTYSSSKGIHYTGIKLHCMGMSQANKLPMPVWMDITSASQHDLPSLRKILPQLWYCNVFGDKAYIADDVEEQLKKQHSQLFCPEKNKKGENKWERCFNKAFRSLQGRAVSSVRQPIEYFFN